MEEMKQVLDNINIIYREKLKEISDIKTNLEIFKSILIKEQSKADGIFIAREEVLNAYCKMQSS